MKIEKKPTEKRKKHELTNNPTPVKIDLQSIWGDLDNNEFFSEYNPNKKKTDRILELAKDVTVHDLDKIYEVGFSEYGKKNKIKFTCNECGLTESISYRCFLNKSNEKTICLNCNKNKNEESKRIKMTNSVNEAIEQCYPSEYIDEFKIDYDEDVCLKSKIYIKFVNGKKIHINYKNWLQKFQAPLYGIFNTHDLRIIVNWRYRKLTDLLLDRTPPSPILIRCMYNDSMSPKDFLSDVVEYTSDIVGKDRLTDEEILEIYFYDNRQKFKFNEFWEI